MKARALMLAAHTVAITNRGMQLHVLRTQVVTLVLLALFSAWQTSSFYGAPGATLFGWLTTLNWLAIVIFASISFAATIADEREQGTLDLLRLTGFGAASILLGKATGGLVSLAMVLVAQLPFVLLSVTLGGVSTAEIFDWLVSVLSFALLSASVGICASVVCATHRRAAVLTVGVLILAGWLHSLPVMIGRSTTEVAGLQAAVAVVIFACACLAFPRSDRGAGDALMPPGIAGPARRTIAFGRSPIAAKEFHFRVGGATGVVLRAVGYLAFVVLLAAAYGTVDALYRAQAWVALIAAFDVLLFASRVFREEIDQRTLPLLLASPLRAGEIVGQKLSCLWWIALPPGCFLLVALLFLPEGIVFGMAALLGLLLLMLAVALTAWFSIRSRGSFFLGPAIVAAVFVIAFMVAGRAGAFCLLPALGVGLLIGALPATVFVLLRTGRRLEQAGAES